MVFVILTGGLWLLRQYTSICVLPQHDQNPNQSTGLGTSSQTNTKICPLFFFAASGHSLIFLLAVWAWLNSLQLGFKDWPTRESHLFCEQVKIDQKYLSQKQVDLICIKGIEIVKEKITFQNKSLVRIFATSNYYFGFLACVLWIAYLFNKRV